MAWWETGEGDDVSSDQVVDVLVAAFDSLAEAGIGANDTAALVRIWQDALNAEAGDLVDGGASGYSVKAGKAASEKASPIPLRTLALQALRDVAGTYYDAKDRAPRPSELAYGLHSAWTEVLSDEEEVEAPPISIEPLK